MKNYTTNLRIENIFAYTCNKLLAFEQCKVAMCYTNLYFSSLFKCIVCLCERKHCVCVNCKGKLTFGIVLSTLTNVLQH